MIKFFHIILCMLAVSLSTHTYAKKVNKNTSDHYQAKLNKIKTLRPLYLQAEKAYKAKQYKKFNRLLSRLNDYPLYPHLKEKDLSRRLKKVKTHEIENFLSRYGKTLPGKALRQKWLILLSSRRQWQSVINFYKPTSSRSTLCIYKRALFLNKQQDKALQGVGNIWMTHRNLPKNCNFIISQWQKSGKLNRKLVWQRAALMFNKRQRKRALKLALYLPKSERYLMTVWSTLHRKPALLATKKRLLTSNSAISKTVLVFSLARLANKDPDKARKLLNVALKKVTLQPSQLAFIQRSIGMTYAYRGDQKASFWLAQIPEKFVDKELKTWRVRVELRHQNWAKVLHWLERIDPVDAKNPRWHYWRARALEALGKKSEALSIYHTVAKDRSYEGFLAADRLKKPYLFQERNLRFSKQQLLGFETRADILIAREFYFLKRTKQARREWWYLTQNLKETELRQAAVLAKNWGWLDRAILTLGKSSYRDDLSIRFPVSHKNTVIKLSQRASISPAWAMAVIRRESAFAHDARSHVGARGLMQLMPATARSVARVLKTRVKRGKQLDSPDFNIKLGTTYLRLELNKFDGHTVLATAAYNAGPSRVKRWIKKSNKQPADIWIETIPFKETRNYTRNVMAYMTIYERKLGLQPKKISDRLRPISTNNSVENSSVVKF